MLCQDSKNLINSIRFNNPLDLTRGTRQQFDKTKLLGITIATLAGFHNRVDISVFHYFKANVRHIIHS